MSRTGNWEKLAAIAIGDGLEAALWRDEAGKTRTTMGRDGWVARMAPPGHPFVSIPVDAAGRPA